jgi:serine/threonine protein kinase
MGGPREIGEGRYRLGEVIGSGAMGAVFAAIGPDGERVAVKLLHEHLTQFPEVVARFKREAELASRIESPHVAPVLAAGKTLDGVYWIAYGRLVGETLEEALRRERVFSLQRARVVTQHVLLGLEAAHAQGILHRDIKPANVFLERCDGGSRACVLDFGASKHRPTDGGATSQHLTTARETLGTINYMPPEQFSGAAEVDARADLYATGVIAFKLLTGRLPFHAGSRGSVMQAKVNGRPLSLEQATESSWPEKLEGFFRCALEREPARRFAHAAAMQKAWSVASDALDVPDVAVLRGRMAGGRDADDTAMETAPESTL